MEALWSKQVQMEGWNQEKLKSTTALCLGVGGLGSVVAMSLCRLGVGKLILIDYDVVDMHNLNRQLLFCKEDVGRPKVEAARDALVRHSLASTIEIYNMNIVQRWGEVVALAQGCSVIFNMIDYGDHFDVAAQSLALKLQVPLIQGGTFSSALTIDTYIPGGKPCLVCLTDGLNLDIVRRLTPDQITTYADLNFIPKSDNPVGRSNVYLCSVCGYFMASQLVNILNGGTITNRFIFYVSSMELVAFPVEGNPQCLYCAGPAN